MTNEFTAAHLEAQHREILKGYYGLTHRANRIDAEQRETSDGMEAIRKRCDELERKNEACMAKIGELQEAVEKMREWAKTVKQT